MGTTRTAILNDDGVQLAFVLIIEGYSKPITTWHDLGAVDTAWSGTDFNTGALPGLEISGNIEQRFRPFSPDMDVSTLTFRVVPEEDDTFGTVVFKSLPGEWTYLNAPFATDDTTLTVKDNSNLPTSGTVYIGSKAVTYSAKVSTTGLTIAKNGAWAPFATNSGSANVFPDHFIPPVNESVGGNKNTAPPIVSDHPKTWVGKMVGLWAHRVVEGVLDVGGSTGQAELLFAGHIDEIGEDSEGATVLQCSDFRGKIASRVSHADQWRAVPKEGLKLADGAWFSATLTKVNTDDAWQTANDLTCTTGASGNNQFEPGTYTAEDLCNIISIWLNNDATITAEGGAATWEFEAIIFSSPSGPRFRLIATRSANNSSAKYHMWLFFSNEVLPQFLGIDNYAGGKSDSEDEDAHIWANSIYDTGQETFIEGVSAPYRIMPLITNTTIAPFKAAQYTIDTLGIEVEATSGTFHNMTSDLPPELQAFVGSGETWSLFSVDDKYLFLGQVDSATSPTEITDFQSVERFSDSNASEAITVIRKVRSGNQLPVIKQVITITGTFETVMARLFMSIDGNGTNHSTYDNLPRGIGFGVPSGLLGANFLDSLNQLEEAGSGSSMTVTIEKPTKSWELIASELVVRGGFLVFRDGGFQVANLQTPNASNADWTLNEDSKGFSPGARWAPTTVQHTSEYLISEIKIEYDRDILRNEYKSTWISQGSDMLRGQPLTIKARNAYSSEKGSGSSIEALAQSLTAQFLPPFNKPVRRWRRSISPQLFLAAPGDTVAFTDDWVRNPTTGQRGTTGRGATVLAVGYSFGVGSGNPQSMNGYVEMLFADEDRMFPMGYAAESNEALGASAWAAGTKKLYVKENAFSLAAQSNDNTNFSDTDAVRILELDPADPTTPDEFTDVINGATGTDGTGDYIILTDGFGAGANPAFVSTKIYLVLPDDYGSATSTQVLRAYQCDDADGYIVNSIEPNVYGVDRLIGQDRYDLTRLPSRHSTSLYGDGKPFTPAHMDQAIRMHNNLLNYKTAICYACPIEAETFLYSNAVGDTEFNPVDIRPIYVSDGFFTGAKTRKLVVAPIVASSTGNTVNVRSYLMPVFPVSSSKGGRTAETNFYENAPAPKSLATWTDITATTPQHLSTTELTIPRMYNNPAITMLVTDINVEDGSGNVSFYGYHCLYMKELE